VETVQLAEKNNIELITTALIGKSPDEIIAAFCIDETSQTLVSCPAGYAPTNCKYKEAIDTYRAHFDKKLVKIAYIMTAVALSFKRRQRLLGFLVKQYSAPSI